MFLGKGDVRKALLKTWAELTGGLLIFKYVQMYWALEIAETHKDKAIEDCRADLQVNVGCECWFLLHILLQDNSGTDEGMEERRWNAPES